MKILKVIASGFKNCADNFEISYIPTARKTAEDKEYELQEIADGLFVFSTIGVVGKNASGKTSVLDLLSVCYDILGTFRVNKKEYSLDGVKLTIYFYHEGNIYKYQTKLKEDEISDKVLFADQKITYKKYYKTNVNSIFDEEGYEEYPLDGELPEDTSSVFFVMKKLSRRAFYYGSFDLGYGIYKAAFMAQRIIDMPDRVLMNIIRIFDENITSLKMVDDSNFKLTSCGKTEILSDKELYSRLSNGTTKGLLLYTLVVLTLLEGDDLIIDEVENHFHKTLVENIISLYKDKSVNKYNSTLVFSTHYCELLDLFGRQDNIYITKADKKVNIHNMYKDYDVRAELLKSKQFYNNVFETAVNYEALMSLKKELK
nr:AAA family ATPase [uncultured Butyrivibrio sp.]